MQTRLLHGFACFLSSLGYVYTMLSLPCLLQIINIIFSLPLKDRTVWQQNF